MGYIVFARKYRPQVFGDIVGQAHITTTLKNAISQNRVAHAYLFSGPRGVGKTTTARILAKALNCEKGPSPDPCNSCASCKEITQGSSLDVLEIDGASNRGIDEIRSLRENVKFSPSKGDFKVYIIDEVHMLSQEAFNALLKTLEEPPPHVKFIFATTHPHKVPATILSRCQRFDFRRLSTEEILVSLGMIKKEEKLNIAEDALRSMARYADGSIRDAQVILDQIASTSKGAIGVEDVTKILGVIDEDLLFGLSEAIGDKDAVSALKIIDRFVNEGKDVHQAVISLIKHFRNILIIKVSDKLNSLIDTGTDKITRYEDEARKFSVEDILYVIYTLSNTIDLIRKTSLPRIPFEAVMVKLTKTASILSLNEITERIDRMGSSGGCSEPPPRPATIVKNQEKPVEIKKSSGLISLDDLSASWNAVINYIKAKKISVSSYLEEGSPVSIEGRELKIGFPKELSFYKEALESPDNRRLVEEAIRVATGADLKVVSIIVESSPANRPVANAYETEDDSGTQPPGNGAVSREEDVDPIVKSALDIFSGKVEAQGFARRRPK